MLTKDSSACSACNRTVILKVDGLQRHTGSSNTTTKEALVTGHRGAPRALTGQCFCWLPARSVEEAGTCCSLALHPPGLPGLPGRVRRQHALREALQQNLRQRQGMGDRDMTCTNLILAISKGALVHAAWCSRLAACTLQPHVNTCAWHSSHAMRADSVHGAGGCTAKSGERR